MKRILSLVLVVLMVAAMLCACAPANNDTTPKNTEGTPTGPKSTTAPVTTAGGNVNNGPAVVTLSDYFADDSKWEDDGGYFTRDGEKLFFDNYASGDYAAVRMNEQYQNVTYKFNVTINKLAEVSMEDWSWWDSEFCVIARSTLAASSWQDDGSQKGYTLTWWGDMSKVCIGRCGMDDAFGEFDANIGDGQAHEIEFTVVNNENGTVTIKLAIDGNLVAEVVDDGTKSKNDRPTLYPDAGGITIRCKWLEATIE